MPVVRSFLVVAVLVHAAFADHILLPGPGLVPGGVAVINPAYCWPEARLFDTLRYGPVDYCRKHLRYRPGRLECAQVSENVCWVLNGTQWLLTRTATHASVIVCPDDVEPPVCPRLTF